MALRRQAALRRCTQGRTGWRQGQCWGWRVSHSLVVRPTRRQPSRRRLKARWHPRWHPQRLADKVRERPLHLRRQTHQPRHCCYCCHRARHRRRHRRTHTPAEASSAVGTVIAGLRSGLLEQQFRGRLRSTLPLSQCRDKQESTDLFTVSSCLVKGYGRRRWRLHACVERRSRTVPAPPVSFYGPCFPTLRQVKSSLPGIHKQQT